jgi:hypothetical protein
MSDRRQWSVPTDRIGPPTKPRAALTRTGLGARLVMPGNPASFLVDVLGPCVPFLSLSGGQDQASREARELGNFDNDSRSWTETEAKTGYAGAGTQMGSRSDLNGGRPFALWGSRKNLPGVKK